MPTILPYLGNALVLLGAFILAISAIPVLRLLSRLPAGKTRLSWFFLIALIGFFFIGYLSYLYFFSNSFHGVIDLIVPSIFFCGAIFVFVVCSLALRTAQDLVRVYELKNDSITDPLMGTFNRRYIDKQLPIAIDQAKTTQKPLAVLLVTIKHYEQLKFKLGHKYTDQLLSHYGNQVSQLITNNELVARYGDDELLIIQPDTDEHACLALAHKLNNHFAQHAITLKDEQQDSPIEIELNIGISILKHLITDPENLIEAADKALYQSRHSKEQAITLYH